MKSIVRISVVVCMVLGMLLAAIPAAAGTKTGLTGTMTPLEYYTDPESQWMSNHIWHWRNEGLSYFMEATDPRLNGYESLSNNGDIHFTKNGDYLYMHIYNQGIIYANSDFTIPLWSCTGNGDIDINWIFTWKSECHGMGSNAGLVTFLSNSAPIDDPNFEGKIYGP
jgi:hypothetical protein